MTTSLSDGDVRQFDVMRWAQEQAVHLSPASAHHVLLYLCLNAFYTNDNPEGRAPGDVMSAYASTAKIQRYTGLSASTTRRSLRALEDAGYVFADLLPGRGKSRITVYWTASADDFRADFRSGIRDLPKGMRRRDRKPAPKRVERTGNVVEVNFRSGQNDRNM